MARAINAAALALIKQSEGLRLTAYPDPGSIDGNPWTIGYGSTDGVKKGDVITEAQAETMLLKDLASAENAVSKLVTVPLNDNQYGALVSLAFNIGNTAFAGSTLLRRLNAGDYAAVPAQMARWNKNGSKVMKGLTTRRANEAALWNTPTTTVMPPPDSDPVPIEPAPAPSKGFPLWLVGAALAALVIVYFVVTHH